MNDDRLTIPIDEETAKRMKNDPKWIELLKQLQNLPVITVTVPKLEEPIPSISIVFPDDNAIKIDWKSDGF